ncbi:MAG: hypothetical protein P3W95_007340 [Tepidimonas taiwanensis]|nr:hypothetical protein [Tepidimonas taiwanensis]
MGLGVAAKGMAPRYVSLQVFALTQVLMDTEPAVRMALGHAEVHGWSHTLWGALLVAAGACAVWRGIEGRRWYRWTVERVTARVVATSALLGALSHVAIDALIHTDMVDVRTQWGGPVVPPWSHREAEIACLSAFLLGGVLLFARGGHRAAVLWGRRVVQNLCAPPAWGRRVSSRE